MDHRGRSTAGDDNDISSPRLTLRLSMPSEATEVTKSSPTHYTSSDKTPSESLVDVASAQRRAALISYQS